MEEKMRIARAVREAKAAQALRSDAQGFWSGSPSDYPSFDDLNGGYAMGAAISGQRSTVSIAPPGTPITRNYGRTVKEVLDAQINEVMGRLEQLQALRKKIMQPACDLTIEEIQRALQR